MIPTPDSLTLEIPSRLHFGLLSFGHPNERQFGGAGLMIRRPGIQLLGEPADGFTVDGLHRDRVLEFARRWAVYYGSARQPRPLPHCRLEVASAPPQHTGLGVGTQLGLGVAAALHVMEGEPCPPPLQLACSVQRGLRSAIGAYGFFQGGFIVERGKLPHETLSPLDVRLDLPDNWTIVLISPPPVSEGPSVGLSGRAEYRAFATLPAVPPEVTREMTRELQYRLLPAVAAGDFEPFAESLYRYGYLAGRCFAPIQSGPYHSPLAAKWVERLRELGVQGVGQSSWGPTLFAFQPDPESANHLAQTLASEWQLDESQILITGPCNRGASFSRTRMTLT